MTSRDNPAGNIPSDWTKLLHRGRILDKNVRIGEGV